MLHPKNMTDDNNLPWRLSQKSDAITLLAKRLTWAFFFAQRNPQFQMLRIPRCVKVNPYIVHIALHDDNTPWKLSHDYVFDQL